MWNYLSFLEHLLFYLLLLWLLAFLAFGLLVLTLWLLGFWLSLVAWFLGPLAPRSSGPLVLWSLGPVFPWSPGLPNPGATLPKALCGHIEKATFVVFTAWRVHPFPSAVCVASLHLALQRFSGLGLLVVSVAFDCCGFCGFWPLVAFVAFGSCLVGGLVCFLMVLVDFIGL